MSPRRLWRAIRPRHATANTSSAALAVVVILLGRRLVGEAKRTSEIVSMLC